jgi:hypothetical protein
MKLLIFSFLLLLTSCKDELPVKLMDCGFTYENKSNCNINARFKTMDACQYYLKFAGGACETKDPTRVICDTTFKDTVEDYCSY